MQTTALPPPPLSGVVQSTYTNAPGMSQVQTQATSQANPHRPPLNHGQPNINYQSHMGLTARPLHVGNQQFALPASQIYSTQFHPSNYQGPPTQPGYSNQNQNQTVSASPTAYSSVSESFSTHGDRRLDYDPNMSPQYVS